MLYDKAESCEIASPPKTWVKPCSGTTQVVCDRPCLDEIAPQLSLKGLPLTPSSPKPCEARIRR